MFKCKATDRDTQETATRRRPSFALKIARLLPGGCCYYLNDKGNEILFRIFSPSFTTIAGLDGAGQWLGPPCHRTSHQSPSSYGATLKPCFKRHQLILQRILLPVLLRAATWHFWAQPSVTSASLSVMYRGRWPYVWTSALNWYEILLYFIQNTSVVLLDFQLSQTKLDVP